MIKQWVSLVLLLAVTMVGALCQARLGFAAEVNGIYTEPSTKDVGVVTGLKIFEGLKVRGWIDTYYENDFNNPKSDPTGSSIIAGGGCTQLSNPCVPTGRTFDFRNNALGPIELAEIELEKVPDRGSVGFKVDLAFGDTQSVIASTANETVGLDTSNSPTKYLQHASVSYLAPIGNGLRIDFGKFVTHIGGETIEEIKNNYTFTHSFLYTYAIPFQDYGFRFNYAFSDKLYGEYYLLNGWNTASGPTSVKTHGFTIGYTPNPKFSLYFNYLGGPQNPGNNHDWRHLLDTQVFWNPGGGPLNLYWFGSLGTEDGRFVPGPTTTGGHWLALDQLVWYTVTDRLIPSIRLEWMTDNKGTMTGTEAFGGEILKELTLTVNYKIPVAGGATHIMVQPTYRYDESTEPVFGRHDGQMVKTQQTAGVNFVYYF